VISAPLDPRDKPGGWAFSPKLGSLRGRLEAPMFKYGEESLPLKAGDAFNGLEPAHKLSE